MFNSYFLAVKTLEVMGQKLVPYVFEEIFGGLKYIIPDPLNAKHGAKLCLLRTHAR